MKKLLFIIILFPFLINAQSITTSVITQSAPYTGKDTIYSIPNMVALTSTGERYIVIPFKGSMLLNGKAYTSSYYNTIDYVIARYDKDGNLAAARQIGIISPTASSAGLKVDYQDSVYFCLFNRGTTTLTLDGKSLPTINAGILKLDPSLKVTRIIPTPGNRMPYTFEFNENAKTIFYGFSENVTSADLNGNIKYIWAKGSAQYTQSVALVYNNGVVYSNGINRDFELNYLTAYDTTGKLIWETLTSKEFSNAAIAVSGKGLVLATTVKNINQNKTTKPSSPFGPNNNYNFGNYTSIWNATSNTFAKNFYMYPPAGSKIFYLPSMDMPSLVTIYVDAKNGNFKWSQSLTDSNYRSADLSPVSVMMDSDRNAYVATNTTARFPGWGTSYSLTPTIIKYDSLGNTISQFYKTSVENKFQYTPFRKNWIGKTKDSLIVYSEQLQSPSLIIFKQAIPFNSITTEIEKEELSNSKISIYPNPAINSIYVLGSSGNIELLTIQGISIAEKTGNNISLEGLNSGVYILKVDGKPYKIIKK